MKTKAELIAEFLEDQKENSLARHLESGWVNRNVDNGDQQ